MLVIFTCVLYFGDLDLGFFHLDDERYVVKNPWIRSLSLTNLSHILSEPYFFNYSPMHILSYALDHVFDGLNPVVFHLSSNLWAGLGTAGVYLLALMLTGQQMVAFSAALLFAAHPAHVEAIVWISSRKDLVAVGFGIPMMLTWLLYLQRSRHYKSWYLVTMALFTIAIAGKLSITVIPAMVFTYEYFMLGRRGWGIRDAE